MAIIYSIGENLVSVNEVERLNRNGKIPKFINDVFEKGEKPSLELEAFSVPFDSVMRSMSITEDHIVKPTAPIGIGKPLTVYIQHIYLGDNGKKDLLVTSAFKSISQVKPAPRAINLLRTKAKKKHHIDIVAAELGTPLIYYSPALTSSFTILSMEMILDRFREDVFQQVGDVMHSAGAVPIFASISQILFTAGGISKILGKLGESIFDGSPFFKASANLTFDFAGQPQTLPGAALLVEDEHEYFLLRNYKLDEEGKLVSKKDNAPYNGNYPYITIFLDGSLHEEYKSFKPYTDAIDILDRFYHLKTPNQQMRMDVLIEALKLYNDSSYRAQAMELKEAMDQLPADSEEYRDLEKKYEAYKKNIGSDLFKLEN